MIYYGVHRHFHFYALDSEQIHSGGTGLAKIPT